MLKWLLWIAGAIVALVALIYGIGLSLPREHLASASRTIPMPVEQTAARLRDVRAYPQWRNDLALEITGESSDATSYVETQHGDRISYRLTEPEPGRKFVSVITDDALPFGGQWSFTLTPEGEGTRVIIEEDGEIRDPLYRFFARFVFGYTSTMEAYLDQLEASASFAPSPPPDR